MKLVFDIIRLQSIIYKYVVKTFMANVYKFYIYTINEKENKGRLSFQVDSISIK